VLFFFESDKFVFDVFNLLVLFIHHILRDGYAHDKILLFQIVQILNVSLGDEVVCLDFEISERSQVSYVRMGCVLS